jgi:hypothetical protein
MTDLMQFIRGHIAAGGTQVGSSRSTDGVLEPEAKVRTSQGMKYRDVLAATHVIAAALNLRSGSIDCWTVRVEPWADGCRVVLKLGTGSEAEFARAMTMLREVFS